MRAGSMFVGLVLFCSVACSTPAAAALPAPNWGEETPSGSPSARSAPAMAFDATNQEMVLFGGLTEAGVRLGDTWTWDGDNWTEQSPAHSPSPRAAAQMAFDEASGQMVLVGGQTTAGGSSETWTWDGSDWTELSPPNPAPVAFNPSLVYDPVSETVLLFGGMSTGGSAQNWTWSWNGATWTQLSPATSPPARYGTAMAYDPVNGKVVLFGGVGDSGGYRDTWTWDGTTWTEQFPAHMPTPIAATSMAYSPATGSLIMPSGWVSPGTGAGTWSWDGSDWSLLSTFASPPARFSAAMQLDETSGKILLFGGLTFDGSALGDTWTFGTQNNQAPTATISDPPDGLTYRLGDVVPVHFSCSAAPDGPPLTSCIGSDGADSQVVTSGLLDTSSLGAHDYSVTATATDGQTGTAGISYQVDRYMTTVFAHSVKSSAVLGEPIGYAVWLRLYRVAGGTVEFSAYGPSRKGDCSGKPAFTSGPVQSDPPADARFYSPDFVPRSAGTYQWQATYSGDENNEPVTGECGGSGATSVVTSPEPVCHKPKSGLSVRAFRPSPPLGNARPVPGIRVRLGIRGDVVARISPRISYATGNAVRTIRLRTRNVRVNRHRKLRFALPARAVRQIRRSGNLVYGSRVNLRLRATLKGRGNQAGCFRLRVRRSLNLRVIAVSGRVALRRR